MKTYPQQHEPWRPDYPPVWNSIYRCKGDFINTFDISEPLSGMLHNANIQAHVKTIQIIHKEMMR